MTLWDWLWLAWLVSFLVVELSGYWQHIPGATLSEHTWDVFSFRSRKRFWVTRRVAFVSFWVALGAHLVLVASVRPVVITGAACGLVIAYAAITERRQ
jgi:hypothetical protein